MITVMLKPWITTTDGVSHTQTSIQISTTDLFNTNDIIDELVSSSTNLLIWYSPVVLPIGQNFYVRIKRHFSDGTESTWSNPKIVSYEDAMVIRIEDDNYILKPIITVENDSFSNLNTDILTLSLSSFISNTSIHYSTTWVVTDNTGNTLFYSFKDTVNLTSIDIDKVITLINNYSSINIYAIYHGSNNVVSETSKLTVTNANYNYNITSSMSNVMPNLDYYVKLSLKDNVSSSGIYLVELVNKNTNTKVWKKEYTVYPNEYIIIPSNSLNSNTEYYLFIHSINLNNTRTVNKLYLKTTYGYQTMLSAPDYIFKHELEAVHFTSSMNNNLITKELYDTTILIPDITLAAKMVFNRKLMTLDKYYTLNLVKNADDDSYFQLLDNNLLIVSDVYNTDMKIYLFSYNPFTTTYTLLNSLIITDESNSLGFNGEPCYIDNNTMYFLGNNKLYNLNINTMTYTTYDLPDDRTGSVLIMLNNNLLKIIGGTVDNNLLFKIDTEEFILDETLDTEFLNRKLKSARSSNGDYFIFKTDILTNDTNSYMYYNSTENTIEKIIINDTYDVKAINGIISLYTGELIIYRYNDGIPTLSYILK